MRILESIKTDINWRYGELAMLKTIPHRYNMDISHQQSLKTYLIPAIYALWEGFVTNSFLQYIKYINSLAICAKDLNINVLTFAIASNPALRLSNPRIDFSKQVKFVDLYNNFISNPINIIPDIPTKSNVNYDVVNTILASFNLELLEEKYKDALNKLLKFRNTIAHGEQSIAVSDEHIFDFINLIANLMTEICLRIEYGIIHKTYLTENT